MQAGVVLTVSLTATSLVGGGAFLKDERSSGNDWYIESYFQTTVDLRDSSGKSKDDILVLGLEPSVLETSL